MPIIIDENGRREVSQEEYDAWFEAKKSEIEASEPSNEENQDNG